MITVKYKRLKAFRWVIGAGLCLSFMLGACSKSGSETVTPTQMIEWYREKIPVGTPIAVAREVMTGDGFRVVEERSQRWKGKEGVQFLRCTRDDGRMVKRRWEFALMHDGRAITSLDLRPGTVYP